jgi:hypothetical protein
MSDAAIYGQEMFSLPHDVVSLPSKGKFYTQKKESIKVGYLTAEDENVLLSPNQTKDGLINTLLRNKIYEPGFDINQLIDVDVQAILIFLRNTSFGSDYIFKIKDPATNRDFEQTILLDELNYIKPELEPSEDGLFTINLPKSGSVVKCRILNLGDQKELDKLRESYPPNMTVPVVTKRLEKQIIELDGDRDREKIVRFVYQMPIADSKHIRNTMSKCEPKLDLERTIIAPSGEKVTIDVAFGAEFFRPFF